MPAGMPIRWRTTGRSREKKIPNDPSFSAQLLLNLDTVRYMVRGVESTSISFLASDGNDGISVYESPEQILGVAPR